MDGVNERRTERQCAGSELLQLDVHGHHCTGGCPPVSHPVVRVSRLVEDDLDGEGSFRRFVEHRSAGLGDVQDTRFGPGE